MMEDKTFIKVVIGITLSFIVFIAYFLTQGYLLNTIVVSLILLNFLGSIIFDEKLKKQCVKEVKGEQKK